MKNIFNGKQYPYQTLTEYYKKIYGEKVYKISVDGGFTCPNRDGTLDNRGCIFCSQAGSGDFASGLSHIESLLGEPRSSESDLSSTLDPETNNSFTPETNSSSASPSKGQQNAGKYILYFQSFTNTYGSKEELRDKYLKALDHNNIVGISIGTRADCINSDVIEVLSELKTFTDVYVELGLQSIHQRTTDFIRKGYELDVYDKAVKMLKEGSIKVVTHVILGLPGETYDDMLNTVEYVGKTGTHGIKLQLLHVLTDTDLYAVYKQAPFELLTMEQYIGLVVDCISILPQNMVLHRLTGDAPKDLLFGPKWSCDKRRILGTIAKQLKEQKVYQGMFNKRTGATLNRHLFKDYDSKQAVYYKALHKQALEDAGLNKEANNDQP